MRDCLRTRRGGERLTAGRTNGGHPWGRLGHGVTRGPGHTRRNRPSGTLGRGGARGTAVTRPLRCRSVIHLKQPTHRAKHRTHRRVRLGPRLGRPGGHCGSGLGTRTPLPTRPGRNKRDPFSRRPVWGRYMGARARPHPRSGSCHARAASRIPGVERLGVGPWSEPGSARPKRLRKVNVGVRTLGYPNTALICIDYGDNALNARIA